MYKDALSYCKNCPQCAVVTDLPIQFPCWIPLVWKQADMSWPSSKMGIDQLMTEDGSSKGNNLDEDADSDSLDQGTQSDGVGSDSLSDSDNDGVDAVEEESVMLMRLAMQHQIS